MHKERNGLQTDLLHEVSQVGLSVRPPGTSVVRQSDRALSMQPVGRAFQPADPLPADPAALERAAAGQDWPPHRVHDNAQNLRRTTLEAF